MSTVTPTGVERQLADDAFIVSKTDASGRIVYANRTFVDISGYSEQELLGQGHSLLRHPDMPKAFFALMWEMLRKGDEFLGYINNLGADGSHHWGFATMIQSFDDRGRVVGYFSVRRKPRPGALEVIVPLYRRMREVERRSAGEAGVRASRAVLDEFLHEKGVSYGEFVFRLQSA